MTASHPIDHPLRILITGANRGIGLELARQYSQAGWEVVATCRDPDQAVELAQLAETGGEDGTGPVRIRRLSVTDWEGIRELAGELEGEGLDMLINNAGVRRKDAHVLGEVDPEAFMTSVEVNALGALKVAEAFHPHLAGSAKRAGRPLLVMMSSSLGSLARNTQGGDYGYRASKAAMNAVTRSLAADLKEEGITVVAMHPGWVQTDMGGSDAHLTTRESVTRMREVLQGIEPGDTGRFLRHDGKDEPW